MNWKSRIKRFFRRKRAAVVHPKATCPQCLRMVAHTKDGKAFLHRCEVTREQS